MAPCRELVGHQTSCNFFRLQLDSIETSSIFPVALLILYKGSLNKEGSVSAEWID
jgi:hypothetical protein